LIILVVVIPLYIIMGWIYKRFRVGTTGIESCPNVEFWRDFPGLVKDGIRFTFSKVTSCCGTKGENAYQTVE